MKQVFTTDDRFKAMNFKNLIENAGIEVELRNDLTAGGAMPGHDVWLELWVAPNNYQPALEVIQAINDNTSTSEWTCENCNESNAASFEICWNCQQELSEA